MFVTNKVFIDRLGLCELLPFWRHPLTAEDPVVSKCDVMLHF